MDKRAFVLNDTSNKRYAAFALHALRSGDMKVLLMHSDDFIKENASQEDYEYWKSAKESSITLSAVSEQ